ncbi:hypothetical protein P43SY_009513 [Pythium insidiosum]|uniref:Kinesin-like protein n=1 Tax=Pythium insidiosum TaxID=114742 RepID=A0AAD5Q8B6_PYTIN|nr:hypothetical protein P43SY_009513 [Pythium insidiosum]
MHRRRRSLGATTDLSDDDALSPETELDDDDTGPALRPLTSHARIEGAVMPPIFPSVQAVPAPTPVVPGQRHRVMRGAFLLPQIAPSATTATATAGSSPTEATDERDTEEFKRAMWAGQANILVTVRVRPHCSHDRDDREIVKVIDHKVVVVLDRVTATAQGSPVRSQLPDPLPVAVALPLRRHLGVRKLRNVASAHPSRLAPAATTTPASNNQSSANPRRSREKRYAFDYVFTPEDGQQTVYHHTTKFLIHGVLNGFNATVFAYGCTGAGKTYTMLGTPDEPGIMALTLDDLFQSIARVHADVQASVAYRVTVSFLEVYNENIRDLLVAPSAQPVEYLDLREDPMKGPVVAGISEVEACNAQDVMKLLRRGNKHRSQEATAANAVSSRSHAVLQVLVEQRDKDSTNDGFGVDPDRGGTMTSTVKYGKLSLVDLAGSERAAVTQNRGQRLIEGANINRSLLALGNCINALSEKGATGTFVPYRDSKLTRLLKDSLGGNCRTVMIANVSPAATSLEETLNTLKYANRAKNIKTTVTRNVLSVDHHITEYANVISGLKDEIASLKKQLIHQQEPVYAPAKSPSSPRNQLPPVATDGPGKEADCAPEQTNDDWRQAKLKEARGYIVQCFQQRMQLQRSLFELEHAIARLADDSSRLGDVLPEATEPSDANQVEEHKLDELDAQRRKIAAKLQRNRDVMEEFRAGILQSPTTDSTDYLKELLLMEYRAGELEVENLILRMQRELGTSNDVKSPAQISASSSVAALVAAAGPRSPDSQDTSEAEGLVPPLAEIARLLTSEPRDPTTQREPKLDVATSRSSGFTLLGDLTGHFHGAKAQSGRDKSDGTSSSKATSPRRQWGLLLNNASLPYIRLRKKAAPQASNASAAGSAGATQAGMRGGAQYVGAGTMDATSATAPAPYLKVLKHRRKMASRTPSQRSVVAFEPS